MLSTLEKMAKINQAFNEIQDVLARHKVELCTGCSPAIHYAGLAIFFDKCTRTTAYDNHQPPVDWDAFISEAVDILVAKDRDFKSAFVKILLNVEFDPVTIWKWEVKKKLDRIRTWEETGTLAVKGEGVKDSVLDLFGYTVLYLIYKDCKQLNIDPLTQLNERTFYRMALQYSAKEWLLYLTNEGLIKRTEFQLVSLIFKYMGVVSEL